MYRKVCVRVSVNVFLEMQASLEVRETLWANTLALTLNLTLTLTLTLSLI